MSDCSGYTNLAGERGSAVDPLVMPIPCWTWQNSGGPGRAYMEKADAGAYCLRRDVEQIVMALDYYRSGLQKIRPRFVPCRVRLYGVACGDGPFSGTRAPAGGYDCTANQYGAVSITATNGQQRGLRLNEFEPIAWAVNSKA